MHKSSYMTACLDEARLVSDYEVHNLKFVIDLLFPCVRSCFYDAMFRNGPRNCWNELLRASTLSNESIDHKRIVVFFALVGLHTGYDDENNFQNKQDG